MLASNYAGKRLAVVSRRPFDEVVGKFNALIAHPEMRRFRADLQNANSANEVEQVVGVATRGFDLMEFMRLDLGYVVKRRFGSHAGRSLRILVGNPVTMSSMTTHVPDAGSYAPVTILIDERPDGVYLSYDTMEAFLTSYGNESALGVARDLDAKVLKILERAAE
jgi:hypothetical protein